MITGHSNIRENPTVNENRTDYPRNHTIHQLFQEQARLHPDAIAVASDAIQYTYKEVDQYSNQIAALLRQKGANRNKIIGIMLERSPEMIIALIAVLKSGASYLPIDSETPGERVNYMLKDSGACMLLTSHPEENYIECIGLEVIHPIIEDYCDFPSDALTDINQAEDPAYIIYTSGSTGLPKGVVISHRSAIRVVCNTNYITITEQDRMLQMSNYSFDASVFEIFGALLNGARLVIIQKEEALHMPSLARSIEKNGITVMFITTAFFNAIVEREISCFQSIRKVLFGGERVSLTHVKKALDYMGSDKLIHVYGPTESTVFATYYPVNGIKKEALTIPIGIPVANTSVLVLDEHDHPVPVGTAGELCISGDGLALGYLNNDELTEQKFIPHPFFTSERMYRTGDLVRWTPEHTLEFLDRMDQQVKLRGFRIELGEIETHLSRHDAVAEAFVMMRTNDAGHAYLCAYMVLTQETSIEELRLFLEQRIPEYMVPSYYVKLDLLPLTANGKINKSELPEPDSSIHSGREYVAPTTELEQHLSLIWKDVLQIEQLSVNDSFAHLGGHSLNAIEVIARINEDLSASLPLNQLFRLGTIQNIATFLEENNDEDNTEAYFTDQGDPANMFEPFGLTGIQLAYLIGRDPAFEMGGAATNFTVEFEAEAHMDLVNATLQKLINRHPILRTVVYENGTQQILKKPPLYTVEVIDVSEWDTTYRSSQMEAERQRMMTKVIVPSEWPLFEMKAYRMSENQYYFYLNLDPLICDDSSLKLLIKEFKWLYANGDQELPELQYNFRDYVQAMARFKQSARYFKDQRYWMDKLEDFPGSPALPLKCNPADINVPQFSKFSNFITGEHWNKLKQQARQHNVTPTSILCAAYAYVLAHWSNQERFGVNLTVFNRIPFHEDVKRMAGDFTTLMLLDIDAQKSLNSFWTFTESVQHSLLDALDHRHYDGVDFIRQLGKKHDMHKRAVMPIVFTSVLNENVEDSFDALFNFDQIKYFSTRTSQVYIDNQVYEINGGLYITWDFVDQLFEKEVIESMFQQYLNILNQVISATQVTKLELSQASRQLIKQYNDTSKPFTLKPLHDLLTATAIRLGDQVAIQHHERSICYIELERRSNQIARYLIDQGVQRGDYIGVYGERCIDTIVNIFGVLKAGAAYIPLDPDYPEERKQYIREKANCKFFIMPELYETESLETYSAESINSGVTNDDMAYVIFTSGSTGKPKGVQIKHGAAANTILDMNERFNVTSSDRMMGISSLCFDLSVYDIFGAVSCGACLVLIDDQRDMFQLKNVMEQEKITIWNSVPALMDMCVDLYSPGEKNNDLRLVLLSGDWISLRLPQKIVDVFPESEVVSLGGATEASIWSIYYPITAVSEQWKSIPYGRPLANQQIHVLNRQLQPCPLDVEGELYIGGSGVASGYLHDEEKTRQSFIVHPQFGYIYKTGDFGVLRSEGYVEFLGRKDSQVKIKGYRVELGEIENVLLQADEVQKTAVIDVADENGVKSLFAFVVADQDVDTLPLKALLQSKLPNYMVPSMFLNVDEVPLTANGKVNKATLEQVARQHQLTVREHAVVDTEPVNSIQEQLLQIWSDVFGLKQIGMNVSCFDLGGDSLKIMTMVAEVKKRLHVEVPIGEMFRNDTIYSLEQYLVTKAHVKPAVIIEKLSRRDRYKASAAQRSMYTLSLLENNRGAYHIPMALLMEGEVHFVRLERALQTFIERHEILRTGFKVIEDELVQTVHTNVAFALEYDDLGELDTDNHELVRLTSNLCKQSTQAFDLHQPPLMRAKLVRIGHGRHLFIINFHHIVADGTSQGILMNELLELYSGSILPDVDVHYQDYTAWQEQYSHSDEMAKQEAYWLDIYSSTPPTLELPYDFKRPEVNRYEGNNIYNHLGESLTRNIRQLAKDTGSTLYMVMLSAYFLLLHRYTHEKDLVVGTAASGRLHEPLQHMFGVFVNTIALRNQMNESDTVRQFIEQIKQSTVAAFEHSEYAFDELVRKTGAQREVNRNPLFDTMFSLENASLFTREEEGIQVSPVMFNLDNAKFDLTFNILEFENEIVLNVEYSTDLFGQETIQRMSDNYIALVGNMISGLEQPLSEIESVSPGERDQLIHTFNPPSMEYPLHQTVDELFEQQVRRTPDHVALVMGEKHVTYRELNHRSEQLADVLRKKGVRDNNIVGVLAERSIDAVIGMLAVLKAGGAYLPIDPAYPNDRIHYMLEDSQTRWLLTPKERFEHVVQGKESSVHIIDLQTELVQMDEFLVSSSLQPIRGQSQNLAYVIYTSGSTGEPKGVMVSHQSLVHLCTWHQKRYQITDADRSASYASLSFDAFVWELFPYLLSGASVHLIQDEIRLDVVRIKDYFHQHQISIAFLPTAICEQFIRQENHSLRTLLTGGDKLNYFEPRKYEIVNNYGPTENTVVTTSFTIDQMYSNIPIGRPLPNTNVFILSGSDQLSPIGVPGELCISGAGLAKGYLNRPQLTAEKFVQHPFNPEQRMYRTGDWVRWLPDGNIEYLGRMDDQVKIRGFRIELGEIEHLLLQDPRVLEAAVVAQMDPTDSTFLCGYVVCHEGYPVGDIDEIKEELTRRLPSYMVPAHFVTMDRLPLTANGKVNRKALPIPTLSDNRTAIAYEPPRNPVEVALVTLWQDILKVGNLGVHERFFDIGGHSLLATILISRLHKEIQVEMPLVQIFRTPTIRGMAQFILDHKKSKYTSIPHAPLQSLYDLSAAQQRIYILSNLDPTGTAYNMPLAMKLKGSINKKQLNEAFSRLIARHESLRTSFVMNQGKPAQRVMPSVDFEVQYSSLLTEGESPVLSEWVQPFSLEQAPLMRAELVQIKADEHVLLFDMHHMISDGISIGILLHDLAEFYNGKKLPPVAVQYKDYSLWAHERQTSSDSVRHANYWSDVLKEEVPVLDLPLDSARPKTKTFNGDQIRLHLDKTLTAALERLANDQGATMYMLFVSAFTTLLSRYTGQEDILIGTPVSGRNHDDLNRVVGMFVNTIVLRNAPLGHYTFRQYLEQVKENTLQAYEHQEYPFERLVEQVDVRRDPSRNLLFDVMLVQNTDHLDLQMNDVEAILLEDGIQRSKFDMTARMNKTNLSWNLELEYNTDVFRAERIQRFAEHFVEILRQVADAPEVRLDQLDILTQPEKTVLTGFNPQRQAYKRDKTLVQMFMEQVERNPDNIALVFENEQLTYRMLNERANVLACELRKEGAGPNHIVAVMVERSINMIVAIVGVLKSGAAYMPIDPELPTERKRYTLTDSGARLLCTADHSMVDDLAFEGTVILLDALDRSGVRETVLEPDMINHSSDAAYVIYTSGSTGRPKGVVVEHYNVHNLVDGLVEAIYQHYETPLNIALIAPYIFDASVKQIFAALLLGHALHIVPKSTVWEADLLLNYYAHHHIHVSDGTPAHLKLLTLASAGCKQQYELRELIIGGDVLTFDLLDEVYTTLPGMRANVTNVYGPTECTVDAAWNRIMYGTGERSGTIPIGRPIRNTSILIMDRYNRPQPVGVPGELCISGEGVARGYLNQLDLTAEKFVDSPVDSDRKMYRTGDTAKWLPDGTIEFVGRQDDQVKIRGYRIELGEVEYQLTRLEVIQEAFVNAGQDDSGNDYLCAYIVITDPGTSIMDVRERLELQVPSYMIPAHFVKMDHLPRTVSGKVDRSRLPEPGNSILDDSKYESPRNDKEQKLVQIWENILNLDCIGIHHNFFVMGGDSIKALQTISGLSKLGLKVEMKDLFANPTIRQLSPYVKQSQFHSTGNVEVTGEVFLTPIQQRFFARNHTEHNHYNQAFMLFRQEEFDEKAIRLSFDKLMEHHDGLRMVYEYNSSGEMTQTIRNYRKGMFEFDVVDARGVAQPEVFIEEQASLLQKKMRIHEGQLVKLRLFRLDEGEHLLITIHHLVMDGVSWRILLEDFEWLYMQAIEQKTFDVGPKTVSYQQFAAALKSYAKHHLLQREQAFWQNMSGVYTPFMDHQRPATDTVHDYGHSDTLVSELDREQTGWLLQQTNRAYQTEINDILLTALMLSVTEMTGQARFKIMLEGHGRQALATEMDVSRTVGWFTSVYPVVFDLFQELELPEAIKTVKETLRAVPNKGIGYGILKYMADQHCFADEKEAPILFNYMGELDSSLERNLFSSSHIPVGKTVGGQLIRAHDFEINAVVIDGKFTVHTTYSDGVYEAGLAEKLNRLFMYNLQQIVQHCRNKQGAERTPSDYGKHPVSIAELEAIQNRVDPLVISKVYPLTLMQSGMLYHSLEQETSHAYFEQVFVELKGNVDVEILKYSLGRVIQRHEGLRSIFEYQLVQQPRQLIIDQQQVEWLMLDWTGKSQHEQLQRMEQFMTDDQKRGFDLSRELLIRFCLISRGADAFTLVISHHHILLDGWCLDILIREMFEIYASQQAGQPEMLEETRPLGDYLDWLDQQNKEEALAYWKQYLQGYYERVSLPKTGTNLDTAAPTLREQEIQFPRELTSRLKQFAVNNQVTFNALIQAIWGMVLCRYSGTEDVIYGTVISGRDADVEGIENMVGLFINTIPTRVKLEPEELFADALRRVQQEGMEGQKYGYVHLADIQDQSELKADLLDHVLVFQNFGNEQAAGLVAEQGTGVTLERVYGNEHTHYDLSVTAVLDDTFRLKWSYNSNVLDSDLMNGLGDHVLYAAEQISANQNIRVSEIALIGEQARHKMELLSHGPMTPFPKEKTLSQLFDEQAERTPDAVALVMQEKQFTYLELQEKSNQMSERLRMRGIQNSSIVGLMVQRSSEMIISILGILKSGAAYLPIDPEWPRARIVDMLHDSGAALLVTEKQWMEDFTDVIEVMNVRADVEETIRLESLGMKESAPTLASEDKEGDDLAYIIYTSGSTGKPKGVMISHANAIRVVKDTNYIQISSSDSILQISNYAFDGSIFDIFGALLNGARLVMIEQETLLDINQLSKVMTEERITVCFMTTALFNLLVDRAPHCLLGLRKLLFGGERASVSHAQRALSHMGADKLIHVYGPTESTVFATSYPVQAIGDHDGSLPIGKPIANTSAWILDDNQQFIPNGVPGELYLSGDGLSIGYLNNEDLTEAKFVNNPYQLHERMYRTGDRVRRQSDGTIEFMERMDHQVKLRGYRIELGEIEQVLISHEHVREAMVVAVKDSSGQDTLCAYVTALQEVNRMDMQSFMEARLPGYMIPSYFKVLEQFPLTPNGKIDRQALPRPEIAVKSETTYEAPSNYVEEQLINIWEEVLNVKPIGTAHHFFECGGNSLKVMHAVHLTNRKFQMELKISQFFEYPTIKQQAIHILSGSTAGTDVNEYVEEEI
ncbi:bacitracin synthase 1 [Paenibacillus xylanexedens]|uniref:non-ribosomal peptide synthetase n=1 Tax=Paenibacillus xylanexedens TaxID=528191 RepID=UPI0020A1C4AD|nr:non-ribosomal peptide synthetase [Paenibacillus xylanexedens]MCP1426501.1 bacitracin synthase 1 [Paenibacillus xylanexedens]